MKRYKLKAHYFDSKGNRYDISGGFDTLTEAKREAVKTSRHFSMLAKKYGLCTWKNFSPVWVEDTKKGVGYELDSWFGLHWQTYEM